MAKYKSRVTNKYMGSGFEGYVASAKTTEGLELAKALQNTGERGMRIANVITDQKKDKAVEKIQGLYSSGKSMEEIQTEILAGKHPDLTGKYVEKTTQFHLGKVKAAEVIKNIEANKNNYDFEKTNLTSFYEQFLPNFDEADNSYTTGFASVFNNYKANESIKDAEVRSAFASKKKIEEGQVQLSIIPDENLESDYINTWKALNIDVPNTDGGSKPNKLYTNKELQSVIISDVESIIDTATTMEEIERAETIMNLNMGTGDNGTDLGTLNDRKSTEVNSLKAKLVAKKRAVLQQTRSDEAYLKGKKVEEIFTKALTPNDDGTKKSKIQLQEIQKELIQFGDLQLIATFTDFFNKNRTVNNDPAVSSQFMIDIVKGEFESYDEMITEMLARGIPESELGTANIRWNQYTKGRDEGSSPIFTSNANYKDNVTKVLKAVEESFKPDASGLPNPNAKFATFIANNFIENEILDYEDRFTKENGRPPSNAERRAFIMNLGKYVIETYKSDNVPQPESLIPFKEAEEKKEKEEFEEQEYKTNTANSIQTNIENVDNITQLVKQGVQNFTPYESTIGDKINVFKDEEAEDRDRQINNLVNTILPQAFSGIELNDRFMKYLMDNNVDIDAILTPIAEAIGKDNNYVLQRLKILTSQGN
tara:strand:- start:5843 stop:7792 length:1950 start_codon:yes stop_codon:yes gene_type:complete